MLQEKELFTVIRIIAIREAFSQNIRIELIT
jgi:hypothetical protein